VFQKAMNECIIKQATLHDMEFLLSSAKAEGWNPGFCDAVSFYYTDPNGFFIEELDKKPIGCISAVAYSDSYGFIGFYIVLPEFRDQGYGIKLWNHAISYLGTRTIGLDGVVAEQENYKKSGFRFFYNNIRFRAILEGKLSKELQPIDTISFPVLVNFDTSIYGLNRAIFLQHWINMPNSYGLAKVEKDKLLGYGIIRKCEVGYKIGPLFANNLQIANEIFLSLIIKCERSEVFLDVIQINNNALELVKEHNLNKVFETARMYNNIPPESLLSKVYGITSFELG
jgi:GNAT superfamily N-acetyltransferase